MREAQNNVGKKIYNKSERNGYNMSNVIIIIILAAAIALGVR